MQHRALRAGHLCLCVLDIVLVVRHCFSFIISYIVWLYQKGLSFGFLFVNTNMHAMLRIVQRHEISYFINFLDFASLITITGIDDWLMSVYESFRRCYFSLSSLLGFYPVFWEFPSWQFKYQFSSLKMKQITSLFMVLNMEKESYGHLRHGTKCSRAK